MITVFAKAVNYLLGTTLQSRHVVLTGSLSFLKRKRKIDRNYFDYVRLSLLELASFEIHKNNLKGNVAELGVYKGKFARYINQYFPDRLLYLFDTFEGFDNRDVTREREKDFSSGAQDFSNTSIKSVLKLMPFAEKCIPVKGFFPESAGDVKESFVFVSIDADLYDPIYKGLHFFYPKLVRGGYIFVHDYNNDNYQGAREAVQQFCHEQNIGFVPIPDLGGSAILTK
ncbi:MAG: methyltransferase [Bacteroidetes bacterium]|nr:MAG: methyltransferase [Bacteroidota bacterium]